MPWNGEPQRRTGTGTLAPAPLPEPEPLPAADPDRPLVVLLGPTASGKTSLAIPVALALDTAIISADSRQVYRYMDIGTAKPTPAERAAVPHHLIDVVDPDQTFTLAQYQQAATEAIAALHAQGKVPLLVGGTGQYITAVLEGWRIPEVPPNPALRAELEAFAARHGYQALHLRLAERDPAAAERIDPRNVRRVVRALEVCMETGTPISALQRKQPPPFRVLQLGLDLPRDQLYARIDARIEAMLAAGLLAEVRNLLEAGYTWQCPALSGLGYVQWRDYLDGTGSYEAAVIAIRRETRAFARRQMTWFRGHATGIQWLDASAITSEHLIRLIRDWLLAQG